MIANRFECIKLKKNCDNLSTVNWTFFIILEIIRYAVFTKLVAINVIKILISKVFTTYNILVQIFMTRGE